MGKHAFSSQGAGAADGGGRLSDRYYLPASIFREASVKIGKPFMNQKRGFINILEKRVLI